MTNDELLITNDNDIQKVDEEFFSEIAFEDSLDLEEEVDLEELPI